MKVDDDDIEAADSDDEAASKFSGQPGLGNDPYGQQSRLANPGLHRANSQILGGSSSLGVTQQMKGKAGYGGKGKGYGAQANIGSYDSDDIDGEFEFSPTGNPGTGAPPMGMRPQMNVPGVMGNAPDLKGKGMQSGYQNQKGAGKGMPYGKGKDSWQAGKGKGGTLLHVYFSKIYQQLYELFLNIFSRFSFCFAT